MANIAKLKVVYSGLFWMYGKLFWHDTIQTDSESERSLLTIVHLPWCWSILHTWRRLSSLSAVLIWSRWVQSGLCQVNSIPQADSEVMWWGYPLLWSLLQLFLSDAPPRLPRLLWRVIKQHQVNWVVRKSCAILLRYYRLRILYIFK